ncbi:MAG: branched-chain amino acid ABC transporter permease [Nakamurella sp.]
MSTESPQSPKRSKRSKPAKDSALASGPYAEVDPPSTWAVAAETEYDKQRAPKVSYRQDSLATRLLNNRQLGWVGFAVAVIAPLIFVSTFAVGVMTNAMIFVMLAAGLNIVVGYCGLLDLGYAAFYAIGAYTSGVLATKLGWPILLTIPAVVVGAILAALIIGGPTLRLRSDYLAIVTLGFGEIVRITANNLTPITGGPSGIYGIPSFSIGPLDFNPVKNPHTFYYLVLVVVALAVLATSRLGRGRLGRAWRFVREDEDAAEAMGIRTYQTKMAAYIAGAIIGGLAGVLWGMKQTAVSPTDFTFLYSALILMAVVLGGMGSVPGIVIGAIVISALPDLMTGIGAWRYFIFGVLLIVAMVFRPQGVWPYKARERPGTRRGGPTEGPYDESSGTSAEVTA